MELGYTTIVDDNHSLENLLFSVFSHKDPQKNVDCMDVMAKHQWRIIRPMWRSILFWCLVFYFGSVADSLQSQHRNDSKDERLLLDMAMTNMGEIDQLVGNQASVYTDPRALHRLGYTGVSTSPERSLALCLTFDEADRVHEPLFPPGSVEHAWQQGYCEGMVTRMKETKRAGLDMMVFTDMIVLPNKLIQLYPEIISVSNNQQKKTPVIVWNNTTEYLMQIMWKEWFSRFPGTDGIIVRTGETYIFDTPFHSGNSPLSPVNSTTKNAIDNPQARILVSFLRSLRQQVCVRHERIVIFRTWWNFQGSNRDYYLNVTSQLTPHPKLYFGVKHTAGDFFRQMIFNPMLGQGHHSQIVEVQIQREYEGKAAYPLYLFEHVVYGDRLLFREQHNTSQQNQSLAHLLLHIHDTPMQYNDAPVKGRRIIHGLWTWSRGGGWWGPYIKGAEFWIHLNLHLIVSWWKNPTRYPTLESSKSLFQSVCRRLLLGRTSPQVDERRIVNDHQNEGFSNVTQQLDDEKFLCDTFHSIVKHADRAMVYGRYCPEGGPIYEACWIWTRDDRIGGYAQLKSHLDFLRAQNARNTTLLKRSLNYKQASLTLWRHCAHQYNTVIGPFVRDRNPRLHQQIRNSFHYAISYFGIIEAAWRAMIYGIVLLEETIKRESKLLLLRKAIRDYDARWSMYRGQALSTVEFPSIYRGYYFNMPFVEPTGGIDETIDVIRLIVSDEANITHVWGLLDSIARSNVSKDNKGRLFNAATFGGTDLVIESFKQKILQQAEKTVIT